MKRILPGLVLTSNSCFDRTQFQVDGSFFPPAAAVGHEPLTFRWWGECSTIMLHLLTLPGISYWVCLHSSFVANHRLLLLLNGHVLSSSALSMLDSLPYFCCKYSVLVLKSSWCSCFKKAPFQVHGSAVSECNSFTSFWTSTLDLWMMRQMFYCQAASAGPPRYKLLHLFTLIVFCEVWTVIAFNRDMCCHLALFLRLILCHIFAANVLKWSQEVFWFWDNYRKMHLK